MWTPGELSTRRQRPSSSKNDPTLELSATCGHCKRTPSWKSCAQCGCSAEWRRQLQQQRMPQMLSYHRWPAPPPAMERRWEGLQLHLCHRSLRTRLHRCQTISSARSVSRTTMVKRHKLAPGTEQWKDGTWQHSLTNRRKSAYWNKKRSWPSSHYHGPPRRSYAHDRRVPAQVLGDDHD